MPEDHRIKSENTDQSGRVLSDRSTKPVFPSPTTMLTDEEKARMADKTVSASTPKLDIATEVASYQAELELQEKAKEKLSAFDGQKGTGAKMA